MLVNAGHQGMSFDGVRLYNALNGAISDWFMSDAVGQGGAGDNAVWFQGAEIESLRRDLLRFARLQLRDAAAEDAVQEALAAAYASRERFAGQSQFRTWVTAILRNKIIDHIRAHARRSEQSLSREDGSDADIEAQFNARGFWRKEERPTSWGDPEGSLTDEQFWRILELCLEVLNENTARVFTMRELLGLSTAEICRELGISESNCWVILHRARSKLRHCLASEWFGRE